MKRIDHNKNKKSRNTAVNTVLIAVIAVLLIAGVVLIMIEPIKRYNRKKISEEALTAISEKIEATEEVEMTYTVPATGNEVSGEEEGYDIIGGTEETSEEADVIFEEEPEVNSGSNEMVSLKSIGILSIGKIKISYSVWDEATKLSLRYGLGHYPDSVMPGETGNATILGHNYKDGTMFHNLGKLKKGDKVVFKSKEGKEMTFVVEESKIINANDLEQCTKTCIINERLSRQLFQDKSPVGQVVTIDNLAYTVVGVCKSTLNDDMEMAAYMPLSTMQTIYFPDGTINGINIIVEDLESAEHNEHLEHELHDLLAVRLGCSPKDYKGIIVNNSYEQILSTRKMIAAIGIFVWIIGIATLIAGIVGVSNIMLITIKERTRELGVRKAMGASNEHIITMVLLESVIITLIFGYIGMMLGVGLTQ